MRLPFILVIVLAISSFSIAADLDQTPIFEKLAKIDQFVDSAPLFINNKSLVELRKLGTLINETIFKEPSKYYPDRLVEFRTLQFDGLEIYGWIRSSGEFAPIIITISRSQWHILYGLDVGASIEKIRTTLGPPTKQTQDACEYRGETECVRFFINGDKISRIELTYYAD